MSNALKVDKELPVSDSQKIKATRNIIVHDYDGINYRIIWDIIKSYLAKLENEVTAILKT